MKKVFLSICLLLILQAVHAETIHSSALIKVQAMAFAPAEAGYVDAADLREDNLRVVGMELDGFDSKQKAKMLDSFALLQKVVNSQEFKDRVVNFKNSRGERAFASSTGLTNEEIFGMFMEGREELQVNTPGEMNFYLRLYHKRWSSVVGYTSPDTNVISINKKYFKNYGLNEVAGNLAHEWCHKLGFGHASAAEHDSVPYGIGYIVEELAAKSRKGLELH
ncbi:MAG TPA: hypothetical protein VNJ01_15735 [Bacteriovoracaceae bacterium]|nr:hypothetical protein [Bacteriovoracaceae bacterium]